MKDAPKIPRKKPCKKCGKHINRVPLDLVQIFARKLMCQCR